MNRVPGSLLPAWLWLLPVLALAEPGSDLNFRPQPQNNARGAQPAPLVQSQSWSNQNPDGSYSYHRSWSYGTPPGQAVPAQPNPAQPGYPPAQAAPFAQPQQGWPGGGAPYAYPQQQPWQGGANPYGFGQQPQTGMPAQQPGQWGGASPYGYGQPQQPGQWGGYGVPQQQPYYQQQGFAGGTPRVELIFKESSAYIHQNLVLTVEVISDSNLRTVSVELPQTEDVVLRELGEATASFRTTKGRREIVNRMHYLLTPMRSGEIDIPPLKVSGRMESGGDYQTNSQGNLHLQVLPADPSVRPWLPLKNLELSARLLNDEKVAEGQPITLVVEQTAEGMSGAQLPSLENKLQTPYHRIYREKTETDGRISLDDKLIGTRVDYFTLVPQKGNRVQIPAVRVDWWNAERQRKETAIIPGRLLGSGELFDDLSEKFADIPFAGSKGWLFWLPLILFAFVAGLYWSWVWARSRTLGKHVGAWASVVFHPLTTRLRRLSEKLSPQRQMHRLRRLFANLLPRSFRLWYCVRAADQENDPDDWTQVLRFLMNRRLGISAQRPMAQLAEEIIALHRPARPDEVRRLLRELEAGLFGQQRGIEDFNRWKRAFKRQIRPNPFRFLRFSRAGTGHRLPELNPSIR